MSFDMVGHRYFSSAVRAAPRLAGRQTGEEYPLLGGNRNRVT